MAEPHDETESASGPGDPDAEAEAEEQLEGEPANAERAAAAAADQVPAEAAPLKAKKKKKRPSVDAAPEPIRDRNRRLREEAAGKRKSQIEARRAPVRNLQAGEIVDDALARSTQAAGEWLKRNANLVQWVVVAGIVGWVGYAIYNYRAGRAAEKASAQLNAAIRAEDARIGSDDSKPDPQTGIVDTRAAYATNADRLSAAEKQYRAIADGTTAASALAKLGLASVLYDQSKYADAKAAYQAVKDSKLAAQDAGVKGRALEGLGMSLESLGELDGAQKAFGELSNLDTLGFGALGSYHQARMAFAASNPEKAKELLKDAQKKLDAATDSSDSKKSFGTPTGYLQQSIRDLLRRIDPNAVSASPNALTADQLQELQEQMGSPGGDGKGMSTEKLQELLKQMSKGGPKAPLAPAPPASAP